jgi:hypothetical protein
MFQAVIRQPFIEEARVQFQAMPTEICVVRGGIGASAPPCTSVSSCKYHSSNASHKSSPTVYVVHAASTKYTNGRTLRTSTKWCYFGHRGTLDMILPIVISDIKEHCTWYSHLLFRTLRNTAHGTPTCYFGQWGTVHMVLPLVISDIKEHCKWYSHMLFRTLRNIAHGNPTCYFGH